MDIMIGMVQEREVAKFIFDLKTQMDDITKDLELLFAFSIEKKYFEKKRRIVIEYDLSTDKIDKILKNFISLNKIIKKYNKYGDLVVDMEITYTKGCVRTKTIKTSLTFDKPEIIIVRGVVNKYVQ
jgi:hypothetical protein